MKLRGFILSACIALGLTAYAGNTVTEVSQVSTEVTLATDVDYVITSTTPFTGSGKVDITNTEHAVLIIQNIRPSIVISSHLKNRVYINGKQAVDGENCQVKMYAQGAIIMPYGKDFKPLTVYSEKNFGGTVVNDFGLEHSGGFMNTLSEEKLNNQIRSFKLKRGYMVTFATGKSGWGYSRCFIADKEDLEFAELPVVFDGRISSYRVFQWYDAQKKGLASDTRAGANSLLGTSWCYDWATGFSHLPDRECVPHQIYVAWPSAAACGSATYACHMKTNNEPGNSADDHPQSVETILNQWQELMRTGLRLCSESSHDGSWAHLDEFIAAVDSRGWRCDILDLHCYWSGGFDNMKYYYEKYGNRPIWISEFVWGASWNNNGIFSEKRHIPVTPKNVIDALNDPNNTDEFEWLKIVDEKETYIPITNPNEVKTDNSVQYFKNGRSFSQAYQQKNLDAMKGILTSLNNSPYVERYAYWNSEADCSKVLRGESEMSLTGEYYRDMKSGMAYRKAYEKIPNVVYSRPDNVTGAWANQKAGIYKLSWEDTNGDMFKEIQVQRRNVGKEQYDVIEMIQPVDQNAKKCVYAYQDTLVEAGEYEYRIVYVTAEDKMMASDVFRVAKSSVQDTETIKYGELSLVNVEEYKVKYVEAFENTPIVFMGAPSNKNSNFQFGNLFTLSNENGFTYTPYTWATSTSTKLESSENIPFMAIQEGNYRFSELDCVVGSQKSRMNNEDSVLFANPFPEDVVPVVMAEINNPNGHKSPMSVKIWDITNAGFKYKIMKEEQAESSSRQFTVGYMAITPGEGIVDKGNGLMIAAGRNAETMSGTRACANLFMYGNDTLRLEDPYIFANLQTNNYDAATLVRINSYTSDDTKEYVIGGRFTRVVDSSRKTASDGTSLKNTLKDDLGWIALYESAEKTSIDEMEVEVTSAPLKPYVVDGVIYVDGCDAFEVYTTLGVKVNSRQPQYPGVYVVRTANASAMVVVR